MSHNLFQRWTEASEPPLPTGPFEPRCAGGAQTPCMLPPGERSILGPYERDRCRPRTVSIENQAIPIPRVAERLDRALTRGGEVVLLVHAIPEDPVYAARKTPERRALFDGLEALGPHSGFRLAGIAALDGQERRPVYVPCKLMIVDDAWTTIGSCNLHAISPGDATEMNASNLGRRDRP